MIINNANINKKARTVLLDNDMLGVSGENEVEKIVFNFDDFVDGIGMLEIKRTVEGIEQKYFIYLTKVGETYELEILSSLLQTDTVDMNLMITSGEAVVFKSKIFKMHVANTINSTEEIPDEYPTWIDIANARIEEIDVALAEVDNLDIDANKVEHTVTVTITKKDGTQEEVQISDGDKGDKGDKGDNGDDYVITDTDYEEIADIVINDVQPILDEIESTANTANTTSQTANSNSLEALSNSQTAISTANTAEAIARGKAESRAFDTLTTMTNWISNVANKGVLKTGDNLYIIQTDIPDYWVVEPLQTPNAEGYYYTIAMLETEKPDLSNMVTTNTIQVITGDKNFTGALKKNNVNVVADDNYTHTDNNYTTQEKNKLAGLENYNDTEVRADITDLETNKANISDVPTIVRSVRPINKTALDTTCVVNTIYTLGLQTSVSIVLPATAQVGDNIEVQFVSGTTPTTLSISSSAGLLNSDVVPEANTQYSIIASWESIGADTYGWKIYSSEAEV